MTDSAILVTLVILAGMTGVAVGGLMISVLARKS